MKHVYILVFTLFTGHIAIPCQQVQSESLCDKIETLKDAISRNGQQLKKNVNEYKKLKYNKQSDKTKAAQDVAFALFGYKNAVSILEEFVKENKLPNIQIQTNGLEQEAIAIAQSAWKK